ncbi:toxin glutamine deamidase domain-containing protein [Actinoallomurus iriomotensis]|uniref:Tox-PL domain-containing protein n=1 Tax=Actinoallomurus iriomotensis TaxID=478107 RepID=A0A9W6VSN4_9ACTN|nr:toxin glutamine deamidase domain-containing protein [Actinoallomurus iriomotensis]GLY83558.1 hypothetical protein Airi02_014880 [Actinoallomurus iriomotensis]
MAIEVPEGVQGLFLVLTGEKWPTANEDALREVGNAWGTAGDRLENELAPYLLQVVQNIRANFTGKSAIKFADMMAPYVVDQPRYVPQAAAQFQQLKKFLLDAATQVEYVKIISIEELVLLIAQIAWAIAMAFWTDGASMTWLAARMAIVRFLLKTWWGRLVLQFVLAELFGIAFQLALDVLTQAIQFAKGTRTSWDVQATISAVEVGAIGGLLSLPFSAISHFLSHRLTNGLTRLLGREVNVTTLQPVVVRAVNGAARDLGKDTPIPQAAKSVTEHLFRAADKPLRIRLTEIGVPAIIEMTEEGLHEAITEGVVMAVNGQGFQFNPFSFTSGVASSIATQGGHGIGKLLATPKPVRQGYTALGDGGDEHTPLLAGETAETETSDDGESLFGNSDEDTTTPAASPASSPPSSRPSSPSPGDGMSRNTTRPSGSALPPRVPPKDTGSRTGPVVGVSRNGSPSPSRDAQTPPPVPPKDTPSRTGRTGPSTNLPPSRGRANTAASESTPTTRSSTATPKGNQDGQKTTSSSSSRNPFREGSRSTTTPPSTTTRTGTNTGNEEATAGAGQGTGGRSTDRATTNPGGPSRSQTRLPGDDRTANDRGAGGQNGGGRSPQRQTNPFRARMEERARAASAGEGTAPTELPAEVIDDATVVPATRLASLDISHVPLAKRLVVDAAEGEVLPAHEVQAAADRIGVEVVARVDRAQLGNGRRKGVQWMSFPADGGRPRPLPMPAPVTPAWSHTPLSDAEFRQAYPWLPNINPMYVTGGDYLTNCLLAAIGVELTLQEAQQNPDVRPEQLHYYQVPPEQQAPYEHLANMGKGDPVDVPGYRAVEHAMKAAGDGARGMLLVGRSGNDIDHVFNVVNRNGRIVYLDGQKGAQATPPDRFRSLQFLPTSEEFPRTAIAERSTPWSHGAYIGSDQPAVTGGERLPFSGRGEVLGEGDGTGGIPGIDPETRRRRAEEKTAARQERPATPPGTARPPRSGKGYDGDPMTFADLPETTPPKFPGTGRTLGSGTSGIRRLTRGERARWFVERRKRLAARAGEKTGRTEPFSGAGHRLDEGDGKGAGIPGLDDGARAESAAARAARERQRAEQGKPPIRSARARSDRTGKGHGGAPMTFADLPPEQAAPLTGEEHDGDPMTADDPTTERPERFPGDGEVLGRGDGKGAGIPGVDNGTREKAKAERARLGGPPAEPVKPRPVRKEPVTLKDLRDAGASEGVAGSTLRAHDGNGTMTVLEQPERVTEKNTTTTETTDHPPPPYGAAGPATPDTTKISSTDVRSGTKPPASRTGENQSTADPALAEARTTLNGLDPERRAEVMNEAGTILGDLSGLAPSVRDVGDQVSRLDRAGVLVAAAIAHSGRAAGETLARELARQGLHEPSPRPVPRVTVDGERLNLARATLDLMKKVSEDHYAQVLEEARLIVGHLAGTTPSPSATRGNARRLALVWLLTAAEIPWAGHQAAEDLAADILGLPRSSTSAVRSRYVTGFANAARNDPGRARTTLGLMSDVRAEGFLNEADTILREATVQTSVPEGGGRVRREQRLLVAAELARSGRRAGTALARALAAESTRKTASPQAKTRSGPRRQVRFADEVTVHEQTQDVREHESDVEDEHGQDTSEAAGHDGGAKTLPPMRVEDVIRETRVGMVGDRVVAIWLPGAPETGPAFDAETLTRLGRLAPEEMVLVFGAVHDGRVTTGEREISVDALAAAIAGKAPGMKPFLLMSGGASVAEPLSRALDEPVLATPYEVEYDTETGDVVSRRPGGTTEGSTPEEDWFRVFAPGDEHGQPILRALFDGAREGWRPRDESPGHSPSRFGGSERGRKDEPRIAPPRPPGGPLPPQPVATPIAADPMIRSIGVPRAGLPQQPELLARIRAELDAEGVRYDENELNLLAHRLLANYPYLLGDGAPNGTNGLQVPIGDAELLISLEATDPHTLNNPAGSTLTPSQLPPVEGEHHAVDTINATYATGAHVQTQSGQTGATRGALSLTFGIGVSPGVLQIVKVGGGISGTTNQSNRSDTHIADAEGGHVEDNRTEARLVSYKPKWSFKLRTDANQSWATTNVHRLGGRTDERLLLWIPDHYLDTAPPDQVTATGPAVKVKELPAFFSASGLTNLPRLFDEIVATLRGQGLDLPMGSSIRQELLQKLWNLNAHLDEAVNTRRGYRITLHNKYGRPVATVAVKSERLAAAPRVGATSDKAHIENVRTAIDGSSGGHTITNSSTLTLPSLEFDLLPNPLGLPDVGLGVSTSLSFTSSNADGISTGRVGLNVLVPRNTSHTAAYRMSFSHRAAVSVRTGGRPDASRTTRPVRGDALVRMPEAAAYEHGFSVDREALKQPPPHGGPQPYAPNAIRNTGRRAGDPATKPVPQYVADGKGVGMGLVMVADGTVQALQQQVKDELRERGFLPANDEDPFAGYSWYGHGNKTDSLIDNLELVEKMVSSRGLDSHYDQIHQDGMTFTLRKRRGGAGVDWDVDSAKVTITATPSTARPPRFIRSTNEFHTVNLAMGMDSAGMSVGHSRKLAWGVKLRGTFKVLKAALTGIEFQRIVGASDSLNFLNNRPELLEYPGEVDEFALTSDYHIRIEYQHSGRQGKVRKGSRDPAEMHVRDQTAQAYLLPLGAGPQHGPRSTGPTPAEVLDQGVVYFLDTTGVRDAVQALGDMADPAGTASSIRDTFASTIELRAHLKEILQGEYTTDRPFEPGLFRDTFGAMDISGEMGASMFTGATNDKFVLGVIKLWLAENRLTDTSSLGWSWDQLDVAVGGPAGHATLVGETDVNRHWQHNRSAGSGRTGGKELIQLDFNRVYSYRSTVNLTVRSRREKHSKVLPSGSPRHHSEPVPARTVVYLLPEPEALTRYADGVLPVSDAQLKDAMLRWRNGRLKLSGDLVARILMRWNKEAPGLPREVRVSRVKLARALARMHRIGTVRILDDGVREDFNAAFGHALEDPASPYLHPRMPADVVAYAEGRAPITDRRLSEVLAGWRGGAVRLSGDVVARTLMRWHADAPALPGTLRRGRAAFVGALVQRHRSGGAPIDSPEIRERFNQAFRQDLSHPPRPYHLMEMPEYLTRDDPNGRVLGHSGVHDLDYDGHRSTYEIVREQIEQVAPGMLAAGAEIWDGRGRRIGRMQGGVDALQSILARGRDQAMWEDVLAKGGYSLYLVNPVGWFLTDVVEVNLADVLTSAPEVHDFKPDTGLENYGHGYIATAKSKSRDGSQAWVFPKFSAGGDRASGPVDLKASEGHHRGTTRAENAVSEQTVYDWSGHYRVRFRHRLTVRVQRLKMPGRPLNNLLLKSFGKWTRHGRTSQAVAHGTLNLQVPRALAEAGRQQGPEQVRNIVPLPKLPGNAYVTGAMVDDLLPAGRKMLGGLFGPRWYEKALGARANDPKTRSSLSLPVLLSRSHLTNHVREATGGDRYKLADNLFIPGDSSERATMWMQGDLFDAQVVGRMSDGGTGTGRYIKHQSGTTVNNSSDLGRVVGEYAVNGNDTIRPQNLPADAPPHRPDHDWEFNHSGNRTTSANQNSSGTENYRREQHAKELGSTLLIRMRGRFWLEAQKTRHHLFRKSHDVGDPVRSDPVTGDVYVEMFEAQYEELRAQMAANTRQAQQALRNRVVPAAWRGMDDAPAFDLHSLLVDAGRNGLDATRAHHGVVRHIRDRAGGARRLALRFGREAEVLRYRAMLDWAIRTIDEDLRAARAVDPTVAVPPSLARYRGYRAVDGIPSGLTRPVAAEITAMIKEVNRIHDLRPDNPLGAPAALPPEASLLSMDPVHLARDVANELNTHVRLDIEDAGGARVRRWVDPAGRIYAFDPATFNDIALTADQATRAGLWSDQIRREALAHGLGPVDLGRFYRTSWADQRTFEQAVAAEIAERRARLETVYPGLAGMFDRALAAAEEWHAEVRRLELEQAELARDITRAEEAFDRRNDQLGELDVERFSLSLEESPDRDALRRNAERTRTLETSRDRRRQRLEEHRRRDARLTRRLDDARARADDAEAVLGDLRATGQQDEDDARERWSDTAVEEAGRQVTDLETLAEGRRVRQAYRRRAVRATAEAIEDIESTLRQAGPGAVSLVVTTDADGTGGRFIVVEHEGRVRWFESVSGLRVGPPTDAQRVYSLDMDARGTLVNPPAELRGAGPRETAFGPVRDTALAMVAHHLDPRGRHQDAWAVAERERPALVLSAAAFEYEVAAEDEARAASTAGPDARIVSLSTAALGPLPADPHLYAHISGRHGIGPAGAVTLGWRPVGRLADFTPLLWLLRGGPRRVPTAADVVWTALGAAVSHLSDHSGRTDVQRVRDALGDRVGRSTETPRELPAGLPVGTWVWFTGPVGTGVAVVTAAGYRVHLTGRTDTTEETEQDVRDELNGRPHTIVVSRAPVGARRSPDRSPAVPSSPGPDTSGGTARSTGTRGTSRGDGTQRGTGTQRGGRGIGGRRGTAPADTSQQVAVDRPLPQTPHLYVGPDGRYRVAAAGSQNPDRRDLGPLSAYAPISWLSRGGPARNTTVADVVATDLDRATSFLTEASVTGETAETVRSLIAGTTGRTVETTHEVPANLPPGTLIFYTGPVHTGAAVVLPDGRYRRTGPGDTTLTTQDRSGLSPVNDGRHTVVIARPRRSAPAKATASTSTGPNEVERAARRAAEIEQTAFDPARLDQVLRDRRLRAVEVPLDNNCFYHSLIVMAGPYLARHISGLDVQGDQRVAVQRLRNWLADRLQADLLVAAQGLPSRYGDFFHVADNGVSIAEQQRALVNQIRQLDSWSNEAGDLAAHIAANELGLPLTLIQDRYVTPLGPDGTARLSFIRTPGHFRGAESTNPFAPGVRWERLRPALPTSAEDARRRLQARTEALERRLHGATTDFETLLRRLPPNTGAARRTEAEGIVGRFRQGRAPDAHPNVPAHIRAQHRLDTMFREVRELERLTTEIHQELGDPGPSTGVPDLSPTAPVAPEAPSGVPFAGPADRRNREVDDYLVIEVNRRLAEFGDRWTGGAVDADQVRHALAELPEGGPKDPKGLATDIAGRLALGTPPRVRAGAVGFEAEARTIILLRDGLDPWESDFRITARDGSFSVVLDNTYLYVATDGSVHGTAQALRAAGRTLDRQVPARVLEIVTAPIETVPGDTGRANGDQVLAAVEEAIERLGRLEAGRPIEEIFPEESFTYSDDARGAVVHPDLDDRPFDFLVHFTAGVPISRMHEFLSGVRDHSSSHNAARQHLADALNFGNAMAADYVRTLPEFAGHRIPPYAVDLLTERPDVSALRGFLALVYGQVGPIMHGKPGRNVALKARAAAASRTSLAGVRRTLPDPVRSFLASHAQHIRDAVVRTASARRPEVDGTDPLGQESLDERWGHTLGDYLNTALLPGQDLITQDEALGVDTHFDDPDTNNGRLSPPLVLVELRSFGRQQNGRHTMAGLRDRFETVQMMAQGAHHAARVLGTLANTETGRRLAAAAPARLDMFRGATPQWARQIDSALDIAWHLDPVLQGLENETAVVTEERVDTIVGATSAMLRGDHRRAADLVTELEGLAAALRGVAQRNPIVVRYANRAMAAVRNALDQLRTLVPPGPGHAHAPSSSVAVERPDGEPVAPPPPLPEAPRTGTLTRLLAQAPGEPRSHTWFDPASHRPVRSAFDVRRVEHDGERVTELTVVVRLNREAGVGDADLQDTWQRLTAGVEEFFNRPRHRLRHGDVTGDLFRVRVVRAEPGQDAHLETTVTPYTPGRLMTQRTWIIGQRPVFYAHEIAHQLGARDEAGETSRNHQVGQTLHTISRTARNAGSLMGDFDAAPEGGLSRSGLRDRHLDLFATLIGHVTPFTGNDGPAPPEGAGRRGYRVSDAGVIRLRDGRLLENDAWVRYGSDFIHVTTGMLLRHRTGEIERLGDWGPLRESLGSDALIPHTMRADGSAIHLTPTAGGPPVRVPLTDDGPPNAHSLADGIYQALSGTPEDRFAAEYDATVAEFPTVVRNDHWTV